MVMRRIKTLSHLNYSDDSRNDKTEHSAVVNITIAVLETKKE